MKPRTIDVYANPYSGIDADGVPQGVVQMPGTRNYIGAFLDQVASEKTKKNRFYFTGEKVTVPFTPEIARAVLEGGLIVADKEHARMLGLSEFVEAEQQLKAERERALSDRRAQTNSESTIADVPNKATERQENAPAAEKDMRLAGSKDEFIAMRRNEV